MDKHSRARLVDATCPGKPVSQVSRIKYRNSNTTEDLIEFVLDHWCPVIRQCEVGSDTGSHEDAPKGTLRLIPDVILIDKETYDEEDDALRAIA